MSLQCVATGPNATQRKQSVIEPPGAPALGPVGSHWAPFTAKTRPNAPVVGRPGEGALNTLSWASVSHPSRSDDAGRPCAAGSSQQDLLAGQNCSRLVIYAVPRFCSTSTTDSRSLVPTPLVVEEDTQEGTMNVQATVILNEA